MIKQFANGLPEWNKCVYKNEIAIKSILKVDKKKR